MVVNTAAPSVPLDFHPFWQLIPKHELDAIPIDRKAFLDIDLRLSSSSMADICLCYCILQNFGRSCGIYLVPLDEFDPTHYLFPNSLFVSRVEQMGNVLNLRLHKQVFNLDDPVLHFAFTRSLSHPSDYCGYHLLHYLLTFSVQQTPSFNVLPPFTSYPNLYDFSSSILEWEDQERITFISCRYLEHYLLEYFLRSLPLDLFPSADFLLQQVITSWLTSTVLSPTLSVAALPDTISWLTCPSLALVSPPMPYHVHQANKLPPTTLPPVPATSDTSVFRKARTKSQCDYCAQYSHDKSSCQFAAKLVNMMIKLGFPIKNADAKSLALHFDLSNQASRTKIV